MRKYPYTTVNFCHFFGRFIGIWYDKTTFERMFESGFLYYGIITNFSSMGVLFVDTWKYRNSHVSEMFIVNNYFNLI